MAGIGTTLAIYDQMTQPLQKIRSSMEKTLDSFEKLQNSANTTFDSSEYDKVASDLKALSGNIEHAEQSQYGLNQAMENMGTTTIENAELGIKRVIGSTEQLGDEIGNNHNQQKKFTDEVENSNRSANILNGTFMKLAGTIGAAFSIKQIIGLSDQMTNITSRLDLMNDGLQTTSELQDMIFESSQRSRGSYLESADAVASLGGNAKQAFENTAEVVHFSELLNKQFTIAGTSAEGVSAATLQLTQAMGMGALRGEELNSVLEQAPNIVQAIADYMDEPIGKIKDLASEGMITSEVVKNAMFSAADDINAKFEEMPMTFAQIWTSFKNQALMSFQPVLQRLNDIANSKAFQNFVNNAIQWVSILAQIVTITFEGMGSMIQWVTDHWSLLAPAIWSVVSALVVYNSIKGIGWLLTLKDTAAKIWNTAVSWAQTAAIIALAFAQGGLNGVVALGFSKWMVYAMAVILVIGLIYLVVAAINHFTGSSISATGIIAGAFAWMGAFILNVIIALINAGIQAVNLLIVAFQIGVWAIQVAIYALGLAFIMIMDLIINAGILVVNLLVNAFNFGLYAIQLAFVLLAMVILFALDLILNAGIIAIEVLVNGWNLGIFALQLLWIGLNVLVRNVLQAILNYGISSAESFANSWNSGVYGLQMAFYKFQVFVSKILQAVGQGAIGVVNSVLSALSSLVNTAIGGLNKIIGMANKIPGVNISTVGTVDLQVGGGVQSFVDSIGSGITAPIKPEVVSLGRSTIGDDYNPTVSAPEQFQLGRSSLASDFLGKTDFSVRPEWNNVIDHQFATDDYLSTVEFPEFPQLKETFEMFDLIDMGSWFEAGYNWGENLEQNIKDFSLKDTLMDWLGMDIPNPEDLMGGLDGMEGIGDVPGIDELAGGGLGDDADKATGGSDKAGKDLGKIADNTDDIADDLGITKEDLKYLRDLASRDFVNRYTNNEINFEVGGITNNVDSELDLDGVVDYVTSGLEEAVDVTVEGGYD